MFSVFDTRDRKGGKFRGRHSEVLFIDARKLGRMVDRTHRELTDEDIARIADQLFPECPQALPSLEPAPPLSHISLERHQGSSAKPDGTLLSGRD